MLIITGEDYAPVGNLSYDCVIACDRCCLHARKPGTRPGQIPVTGKTGSSW